MATPNPMLLNAAKIMLVGGILGLVAIGALLPPRVAEVDAYEAARPCTTGVTNSAMCKVKADAEIVAKECPEYPRPCTFQLRIGEARSFLPLPADPSAGNSVGGHLQVELFQGLPTGAWVDGTFYRRAGAPDEAVKMLLVTLGALLILIPLSANYAWKYRKSSPQAS